MRRRPASPSVGKRRDARRQNQPLLTGDGRGSPLSAAGEELSAARSKSEAAAGASSACSPGAGWEALPLVLAVAPGRLPQQGSAEGGRPEVPWGWVGAGGHRRGAPEPPQTPGRGAGGGEVWKCPGAGTGPRFAGCGALPRRRFGPWERLNARAGRAGRGWRWVT